MNLVIKENKYNMHKNYFFGDNVLLSQAFFLFWASFMLHSGPLLHLSSAFSFSSSFRSLFELPLPEISAWVLPVVE